MSRRLAVVAVFIVVGIVTIVTVVLVCNPGVTPTPTGIPPGATRATVVSVSHVDTVRVDIDGHTESLRLILMDTPETRDSIDPVECCGAEATAFTKRVLAEGTTVYLEREVSDRDRYGWLLRKL